MKPEKIIELLSQEKYAQLYLLAEQEIKDNSIKQTSGSNTLKRIKLINKYLSKITDTRYQKAFMQDDKLCFLNGFTGFVLNEKLDGIEIEGNTFDIKNFIPQSHLTEFEINLSDIKTALKLHRAKEAGKKKKEKTDCYYEISEHWYDAEYLIDCIEILGGDIKFYQTESLLSPAVFESENGKAVIMPVRKSTVDKARTA